MTTKVVAMPVMPGGVRRDGRLRSDLGYARYSAACWRWWCQQHGAEFITIGQSLGGPAFSHMPVTFQRWHILDHLIGRYGQDIQVAIVDADTMIRWDAPDFFALARGFSAVSILDPERLAGTWGAYPEYGPAPVHRGTGWISTSLQAFQHLFPTVNLSTAEYFNAGFVVMSSGQQPFFRKFLDFCRREWLRLDNVIARGNVGTDQTPLNLMLRQEREPVFFLSGGFNRLHCFPMTAELVAMDWAPQPDPAHFARLAFGDPRVFDFVNASWVWHFTNVIGMRGVVMQETWRRICNHYPGASVTEP